MKRVCVFCGSNTGIRPAYRDVARQMGAALVQRGIGLVYGGGCVGLMGVLADAVLEYGGHVIGVIPAHLVAKELAHQGLNDLRIVETMHERKAMMADLADAFIALPGGFGTFEEFCEVLTWGQLGLHRKPCGLLNIEGFYAPLLALFDHATSEGFVRDIHRGIVLVEEEPDRLLDRLRDYQPNVVPKWMDRDEI